MSSQEGKAAETETTSNFSLASTSLQFSTKTNDIFGSLEVLEQKHRTYQTSQDSSLALEQAGVIKSDPVEEEESKGSERNTTGTGSGRRHDSSRHERRDRKIHPGQRSWHSGYDRDIMRSHRNFPKDDFRRPNRPPRAQRLPQFKKNPEKWTSYSLEDVEERELSEKSNTRAALDFLFERKKERERTERIAAGLPEEEEKFESETAACSRGLISFSRRRQGGEKRKENDHASSLGTEKFCDESFEEDKDVNADGDVKPMDGINDNDDATADTAISPHTSRGNQKVSMISDLSESEPIKCDEKEPQADTDTVFKFKSRKNVRKQIRRKDDNYDDGD